MYHSKHVFIVSENIYQLKLLFRKLKLYEEQELTMQVFCEPDHSPDVECRDSADFSHVSF